MALVQFGGDRQGTLKRYRIVTLDRQWDSLKEVHGFTWVSRYTCQSAPQLSEKWNASGVYRSKSLQSQRLEDVWAWQRWVFQWFPGLGMLCYTAWTGRDSDVRLGQCVDNSHVPCHCFAGKPRYQRAAVGRLPFYYYYYIIIIFILWGFGWIVAWLLKCYMCMLFDFRNLR